MHDGVQRFEDMVPPVDLSQRDRLALLVIDMQYHDASPDHGLTRAWEAAAPGSMRYYSERLRGTTVPAIERLLRFFRRERLQVVHLVLGSDYRDLRDCPPRFRAWTRNLEATVGLNDVWWSGNPDFRILEPLTPVEGETVVQKTTNGAFNGSDLDRVLTRMGLTSLVITGVVTSACVDTTARDAADRGYDCLLVAEATADYDAEMQAASVRSFGLNFGRVAETADSVIAAIERGERL